MNVAFHLFLNRPVIEWLSLLVYFLLFPLLSQSVNVFFVNTIVMNKHCVVIRFCLCTLRYTWLLDFFVRGTLRCWVSQGATRVIWVRSKVGKLVIKLNVHNIFLELFLPLHHFLNITWLSVGIRFLHSLAKLGMIHTLQQVFTMHLVKCWQLFITIGLLGSWQLIFAASLIQNQAGDLLLAITIERLISYWCLSNVLPCCFLVSVYFHYCWLLSIGFAHLMIRLEWFYIILLQLYWVGNWEAWWLLVCFSFLSWLRI